MNELRKTAAIGLRRFEQLATQLTEKAIRIAAEPVPGDPHPEHAGNEGQGKKYSDYDPDFYTAFMVGVTFTPAAITHVVSPLAHAERSDQSEYLTANSLRRRR